uniref:DUF1015 family protein n=2 Tax=Pseudoalteromonas sp. N1230-9 TaxID=2907156 RepID=UPI003132F6D9
MLRDECLMGFDKRTFCIYEVSQKNSLLAGVLTEFDLSDLNSHVLLPHESVSVSHAMKLKKYVTQKQFVLPPSLLIGPLDINLFAWRTASEKVASWENESDKSEHSIYLIKCDSINQQLYNLLSNKQDWLIADGHHRVFAAKQLHSSQRKLMVWLTAKEDVVVKSFTLQVKISTPLHMQTLVKHLAQFGIVECDKKLADYALVNKDKTRYFSLHGNNADSYRIQTQLRQALCKLPQFVSLVPSSISTTSEDALTITVSCRDPYIEDIFAAAKAGKYFPEKSTLFTHKADSRVLDYLNQQAVCA